VARRRGGHGAQRSGTLYAFSVFLQPLETLLGLSRVDLAFVFALATVGFGGGMNLAPYVYGIASTPVLVLACTTVTTLASRSPPTAGGFAQLAVPGADGKTGACRTP